MIDNKMDCLCRNAKDRKKRDSAHYEMMIKMAQIRGDAARYAATPGCFNIAKQKAKEYEGYEFALMRCLRGEEWKEWTKL